MTEYIPKIAGHLLTGVILVLVFQRMVGKRAVPSKEGPGHELRYHAWFAWLGILLMGMFIGFGVFAFIEHSANTIALEIGFGSFAFLGFLTYLYATKTYYEITDRKIVSYAFWRLPKTLYWNEVQRVDFTSSSQFKIHGQDRETIRVDMLIGGLDVLLDAFSKYLSQDKYQTAMQAYWKVSKNYQRNMGDVVAIPQTEYASVSGTFASGQLEECLPKISKLVQEGFGKEEIKQIIKKAAKIKGEKVEMLKFSPLFQGMPIQFLVYIFLSEKGPKLLFAVPTKLAKLLENELRNSGVRDVLFEEESDEDDELELEGE